MSKSLLNNKTFNNIKVSNLQVDNQINTIQIEPIYFRLNYDEIDEHTTSEKISNVRYHHIYDQIDITGKFTRHLDWISTQLKNVRTGHGTNIISNIETGDYVRFVVHCGEVDKIRSFTIMLAGQCRSKCNWKPSKGSLRLTFDTQNPEPQIQVFKIMPGRWIMYKKSRTFIQNLYESIRFH